MEVKLISWTKNPIGTVAHSASMCYDSEPSRKIVKGCIKSGHTSVLEHANYTFEIEGVSRAFLAQITRHRHASFSVQSQRYVNYEDKDVEFIYPKSDDSIECDIYRDTFNECIETYKTLIDIGEKPEDARSVLPNSMPTKMTVTMNLRGLMNFMNERLCSRAQHEIRMVAIKMRDAVINCPEHTDEDKDIIMSILVPKCERYEVNFCPEFKSCGRHKKLSEIIEKNS